MVPDSFLVLENGAIVFTRFLFGLEIDDCGIVGKTINNGTILLMKTVGDPNEDAKNLDVIAIALSREGFVNIPQLKEATAQIDKMKELQQQMGQRGYPTDPKIYQSKPIPPDPRQVRRPPTEGV